MFRIVSLIALAELLLTNSAIGRKYRLPKDVKPLRYRIEIRPDFVNHIFTGNVDINVQALKNTSTITLHQLSLKMPSKELITVVEETSSDVIEISAVGPGEYESQEFFVINLTTPLIEHNNYLLKIPNFEGSFNGDSKFGFYYARYNDEHGNQKTFATTLFEPTFARKAFPCFDEPALKAIFSLVIVRPSSNYISVSNTPRDEELSSGLTDVFKETSKMSTYLVAFIVSEMEFSQTVDRNRILAPKHVLNQNLHQYALNISPRILREMENYSEIPYTFEKLDHASIPNRYYEPGGMENWGLITYRDNFFLLPSNAKAKQKQKVVTIIAHEICHQWFGNLVTPESWGYAWLNEGFANYFEHYLADKVEPQMAIWKKFALTSNTLAMQYEGRFTRPMNSMVESPKHILYSFDTIAYKKSGAIIRMLENMVSRPVFKQGLIYYLKDRQFKEATPKNLYYNIQLALNESSNNVIPVSKTVDDVMTTWDSVAGFPLVTVTRNYDGLTNQLHLKQDVFKNKNNIKRPGKWMIPINYATKKHPSFENTEPQQWLINSTQTITISNLDGNDWLVVNVQQSGYYRVNYDEKNWNLIINVLNTNYSLIHVNNRAKLIDDCYHLKTSGSIPYEVCSRLEEYAVKEEDALVLSVLQTTFADTDNKLYYARGRDYFKGRVIYLLQGARNRLTFDEKLNDTPSDYEAREKMIFWLCKMSNFECRTKTFAKYRAWKSNETQISSNLQAAIFCGAMRSGTRQDFNYLFKLFREVTDYHFKTRIASGLSCAANARFLKRFLQYCLDQRWPSLLEHVIKEIQSSSKIGLETVLDLIINNIEKFQELFGHKTKYLVEKIASQTYSALHLKKLIAIKQTKSTNEFEHALSTIADNVLWLKQNEHTIWNSLQRYSN